MARRETRYGPRGLAAGVCAPTREQVFLERILGPYGPQRESQRARGLLHGRQGCKGRSDLLKSRDGSEYGLALRPPTGPRSIVCKNVRRDPGQNREGAIRAQVGPF